MIPPRAMLMLLLLATVWLLPPSTRAAFTCGKNRISGSYGLVNCDPAFVSILNTVFGWDEQEPNKMVCTYVPNGWRSDMVVYESKPRCDAAAAHIGGFGGELEGPCIAFGPIVQQYGWLFPNEGLCLAAAAGYDALVDKYNSCESHNLCSNKGECSTTAPNTYSCACDDGWKGDKCQYSTTCGLGEFATATDTNAQCK